jgi:hypothetical protein
VQVNQYAAYIEDNSLGFGTQRIMQCGHVVTTLNRTSCSTSDETQDERRTPVSVRGCKLEVVATLSGNMERGAVRCIA